MISATDALLLPRAQLTEDERKAADDMEAALEAHIRSTMTRYGCDELYTTEMNRKVLAEVNQRLIRAGWKPTWHMRTEIGTLTADRRHTGFQVTLEPSAEAYQAAAEKRVN